MLSLRGGEGAKSANKKELKTVFDVKILFYVCLRVGLVSRSSQSLTSNHVIDSMLPMRKIESDLSHSRDAMAQPSANQIQHEVELTEMDAISQDCCLELEGETLIHDFGRYIDAGKNRQCSEQPKKIVYKSSLQLSLLSPPFYVDRNHCDIFEVALIPPSWKVG
jgi:hypothetical protein